MDYAHSSRTASDATTPSSPSLFDDDIPSMVKLSFSKNSVYNTVISSEDHDIMYKVSTPNRFLDRVTTIYRMDRTSGQAQFAGEIAWKTLDPQVRIGWQNCEWMPVRQWLRSPRGELSTAKIFSGPNGDRFRWRLKRWRLLLTPADEAHFQTQRHPLATFHQPVRDKLFRVIQTPFVEISPDVLRNLDYIIVSLLIMEKQARDA